MRPPLLALAPLLLGLAACDDNRGSAAAGPDPRIEAARAAAEEPLRARLRQQGEIQQRGVQVYPQAAAGSFAVCGRVTAAQRLGEPLLPYVALVIFERNTPRVADLALGASSGEAARVYAEMVERCFEGGGSPTGRATARALPPLPNAGPSEQMATPAAMTAQAATRSVTTTSRHGVNIRSGPNGGTGIVRVAPRSTPLQVFAEGPGGWVQVGQDGQPWGWAHNSVLDASPTRWVEGAAR